MFERGLRPQMPGSGAAGDCKRVEADAKARRLLLLALTYRLNLFFSASIRDPRPQRSSDPEGARIRTFRSASVNHPVVSPTSLTSTIGKGEEAPFSGRPAAVDGLGEGSAGPQCAQRQQLSSRHLRAFRSRVSIQDYVGPVGPGRVRPATRAQMWWRRREEGSGASRTRRRASSRARWGSPSDSARRQRWRVSSYRSATARRRDRSAPHRRQVSGRPSWPARHAGQRSEAGVDDASAI